ncbi:hypothetical protein KAR91_63525 [Candidatus Pacearchaeota archaeon]|nr:hypothetical protein [Candidatus Pacearchaeota archaeon]
MKKQVYILILALCLSGCINLLKRKFDDIGSLKVSYYNNRLRAKYKDFFDFNYQAITHRRIKQRRGKRKKDKGRKAKKDSDIYNISHRELIEFQW